MSLYDSYNDTGSSLPPGMPLSRYTSLISNTVAMSAGLSGVWVTAELSDVRNSGGHCYMELIEKNDEGQTIAKLRATIWRTTFFQLRQKFYNATRKDISNGLKVLIKGSATHHSLYGLSFNITDIDPSYTMGDMERLRREILMKLQKEGIADLNKSRNLPPTPQIIAVISAEGAAGYGDFVNQLYGNNEGYVFYTCLYPCVMQGEKVSESIRSALEKIESTPDLWDCVVIIRGGGATTDLNGFDDYALAKAVALCGLPVIVGIGHERDRNILDEIAHTSLKTPTAVAGFFLDCMRTAYDKMVVLLDRLKMCSADILRGEERQLNTFQTIIPQLAIRRLEDAGSKLKNLTGKLPILTGGKISNEKIKIEGIINILKNLSTVKNDKEKIRLENFKTLIKNIAVNNISNNNQKLENLSSLIKILDPKNTLKRGYSITRLNGKALTSIENLKTGDKISTTLVDGEIQSVIQ